MKHTFNPHTYSSLHPTYITSNLCLYVCIDPNFYDLVDICIEDVRNLITKILYDCEIYLEALKMDNHMHDIFFGENNFEE